MATLINYYALIGGDEFNLNLGGSGLGFFSSDGWGYSVPVGEYQGRTFVSDGGGVVQGAECQNVKYLSANSGILGQVGSGVNLLNIPNCQSTLNIRVTSDTAIQVQNGKVYIYDRSVITNPPSGVTCKLAEVIHPYPLQNATGSGNYTWQTGNYLDLSDSPGMSGWYAPGSGSVITGTRHDWYVALSCSANSVGSKSLFGMYTSIEYI